MPPKKPPKKSPARGKPGRNKSKPVSKKKNNKKGPPKLTKKQKRLLKKFGDLSYDNERIALLPRDKLEFIAEKMKSEVTLARSDRIKYQLERDFLYDLVSLYMARYKELKLRIEAQEAMTNKLVQDKEEMGIVKGQEAKHFRYECMLLRGRMEMADEMRRQDLQANADRIWQNACISNDEQLDIAEAKEAEFLKEMADTKENLDDLDMHMATMKNDMAKFAQECVVRVDQALKDCAMISKMETVESQEILNEMLFSSATLNEVMFENIQNYYNDMTANSLNVILKMRDRFEELTDHNAFMSNEIERYEEGIYKANKIYKKLKGVYTRTKVKHDHMLRLEQGNATTRKSIARSELKLAELNATNNSLLENLHELTKERDVLRSSATKLAEGMMNHYAKKFKISDAQKRCKEAVNLRNAAEDKVLQYFPGPEAYIHSVEPYKMNILRREHMIEKLGHKLTVPQWLATQRKLKQRPGF